MSSDGTKTGLLKDIFHVSSAVKNNVGNRITLQIIVPKKRIPEILRELHTDAVELTYEPINPWKKNSEKF